MTRHRTIEQTWTDVDAFAASALMPRDEALESALARSADAGLPPISVSACQGRMLTLLARMHGAKSVLEIGTLGGYSTICLARGLAPGGRVTTLELNPDYAAVARTNIAHAGLEARVDVRVGPAIDSLASLHAQHAGPFDFFFIDADKVSTPAYVEWCVKLSRPGSVIIVDNVVRDGALVDEQSDDPGVQGMRRVLAEAGNNPRLTGTVIQTVGAKGYDGFALLLIN